MSRVGGIFGDTTWRELLLGPDKRIDDPVALGATYRGPGRAAAFEYAERRGALPPGTAAAARAGVDPIELGHAVQAARAGKAGETRTLAMQGSAAAAQQAELAEQIVRKHGVWGLHLYQRLGGLPGIGGASLAGAAHSSSATQQATQAASSVDPAVADDMQRFVNTSFQQIAQLSPAEQESILSSAIARRAAAGVGDIPSQVLARDLLAHPVEDVAPHLRDAINEFAAKLAAGGAAAARTAGAGAAPASTLSAEAAAAARPAVEAGEEVAERIAQAGAHARQSSVAASLADDAARLIAIAGRGHPDIDVIARVLANPQPVSLDEMAKVLRLIPRL